MSKYIIDLPDSFDKYIKRYIRVGVTVHNAQKITEVQEVIISPIPYKEPKKDLSEIEVGDEVSFDNGNVVFCVTNIDKNFCEGFDKNGTFHYFNLAPAKKTGKKNKHLIDALNEMKKEND